MNDHSVNSTAASEATSIVAHVPALEKTSKTPVVDKTRRVTIGPVAQRLSSRNRRRSWLPKVLLILAIAGCAYVVRVALNNTELLAGVSLGAYPKGTEEGNFTGGDSKRLQKDVAGSQVGTVIELVGAFEMLDTQDRESRNPLALPQDDSPTTHVAFYSARQEDKSETANFLKQINMSEVEENKDEQPKSILAEAIEFAEAGVASDEVAAPTESADAIGGALMASAVEVVEDKASPPQKSQDNAIADLEPKIELPLATVDVEPRLGDEIEIHESPVSEEPIESIEGEKDAQDDVAHQRITESIEAYRNALERLRSSEKKDRTLARSYYAALAEIGQLDYELGSENTTELLRQLQEDEDLNQLVSSAVSSWVRWTKRDSNGIVISGTIDSISESNEGTLVTVRTGDRKSSTVTVIVESFDAKHAVSRPVLMAGVIRDDAAIHARVLGPR